MPQAHCPGPLAPLQVTWVYTPKNKNSGVETLIGWQRLWQTSRSQLQVPGHLDRCTGRVYGEGKDHLYLPGDLWRYSWKQPGFWSALGKMKFERSDLTFSSHPIHFHYTHTQPQDPESDGQGIGLYPWLNSCVGIVTILYLTVLNYKMKDNSTFLIGLLRGLDNI